MKPLTLDSQHWPAMPSLHDDFTAKLLAAKAGDPAALGSLGVTYFAQRSMPTDMQTAASLLHTAANRGDAEAQNSLGAFYYFGVGVDSDERQAVKWFRKAAEQGHADAQHRLGSAYRTVLGFGVTPDDSEAVKWFRKAANQDHAQAQYDLARQLLHGEGVEKDAIEAVTVEATRRARPRRRAGYARPLLRDR